MKNERKNRAGKRKISGFKKPPAQKIFFLRHCFGRSLGKVSPLASTPRSTDSLASTMAQLYPSSTGISQPISFRRFLEKRLQPENVRASEGDHLGAVLFDRGDCLPDGPLHGLGGFALQRLLPFFRDGGLVLMAGPGVVVS